MKKNIFLFLTLITVYFSSCAYLVNKNHPDLYSDAINVMQIEYDDTSNLAEVSLSINNGSKEIDPNELSFIDIKFSKKMNTSYGGYVYYGDIKDDLGTCYWVDSYTYRIFVNLKYDTYYKIVLNDVSYGDENPDWKKNYFFRDIDGNYIQEFVIEFSTINKISEETVTEEEEDYSVKSDSITATLKNGKDCHIYYFETSVSEAEYKITITEYDGLTNVKISDDYAFYNVLTTIGGYNTFNSYSFKTTEKMKIYIKLYPSSYSDYNAGQYELEVSGKTSKQITLCDYKGTVDNSLIKIDSITATLKDGKDCHVYYFETSANEAEYKITITEYDGLTNVKISDDYAFYNVLTTIGGYNTFNSYSFKTTGKMKIYIKLYPSSYSDYNAGQYKLDVSGKTSKNIKLYKYQN